MRATRKADHKFQISEVLRRWPTATRREIAATLGISHQYVSALVEEMVAEGEVERVPRKARSTRVHHADMKAASWPM